MCVRYLVVHVADTERAQSFVCRHTAPFFFNKLQVEKFSNLLTYGYRYNSCSFVYASHAIMSVRSQLVTESQKEVNNKLNIRTKSIIGSEFKALIIDVRLG